MIFRKIFEKKIEIFQKKKFLEVVISFLDMARKKSFFFEKISTKISAQNSIFIFAKASCFFKKNLIFLIFSGYLYFKERF